MGFKFQPIKKITFPITDENDTPIKTYEIDVGSETFVRAMLEKGARVVQRAKVLLEDPDGYEPLVAALRDFVDYSLGDGEYAFLFEKFGKNVFAMIELSRAITSEGGKAMQERSKQTSAMYD